LHHNANITSNDDHGRYEDAQDANNYDIRLAAYW